ncbi:hypothetical protein KAJ27_25460 [bacterium]|nr:hypothetical protein [bacterium]
MFRVSFLFIVLLLFVLNANVSALETTLNSFEISSMRAMMGKQLHSSGTIDSNTAEQYLIDFRKSQIQFLKNFNQLDHNKKTSLLKNILDKDDYTLLLYRGVSRKLIESCNIQESSDESIKIQSDLSRALHNKISAIDKNRFQELQKKYLILCNPESYNSEKFEANGATNYKILRSNESEVVLDVQFGDVTEEIVNESNQTFIKLDIKGCGQLSTVGKPQLPAFRTFVAIPEGSRIQIQFYGTGEKWHDLKHPVYPVQIPPLDSRKITIPFKWNKEFYAKTERYPAQKVMNPKIIKMKKYKLALLSLSPVMYLPKKNQIITFKHMKLTMKFIAKPGYNQNKKTKTHGITPIVENVIEKPQRKNSYFNIPGDITSLVINPEILKNKTTSNDILENIKSTPALRKYVGTQIPNGADYLIITPKKFMNKIQIFADWKTQKGFITKVVTTESISSNLTPAQLKSYLNSIYTKWELQPSYVLLVGDTQYIPVCDNREPIYGDVFGNIPNDYEYSLLDGDDPFPDVFIGRFPADSLKELTEMIKKTINYELKPTSDTEYYKGMLLSAVKEEGRIFHETQILLANYATQAGYLPYRIFSWDNGTNDKLVNSLNNGCFLACYRGHGEPQGWLEPEFVISDINRLTGNFPTVYLSTTCLSNKFNENKPDCFGEKLIKKEKNGAVVFIGSTMPSYSFYNDDLLIDMVKKYKKFKGSVGDLMLHGLTFMAKNYGIEDDQVIDQFHFYNILGDPSLMPWSEKPTEISIKCPDELDKSQKKSITINVKTINGVSIKNAIIVCKGKNLYIVRKTNKNGGCRFIFDREWLKDEDSLTITITGKNIVPVIKVISIK